MQVLDLTIAIPTRNEEKNLETCLKAIGNDFAAFVTIVDSGSDDNTKAIAEKYGATLVNFEWDGKFPKKRNWFLRNHTPGTKWVLFLDADEYITEDFKAEVFRRINTEDKVGYWLSYAVYFLGKRLKGGYPLKKLALFQVSAGEYEKIDENNWSTLDMEVHEHPCLHGAVGEIKSKIDHRDYKSISHFIEKHNQYSSWEANRVIYNTKNERWTWKQRLKYSIARTVWIGPFYFLGSYVFYGGFRDGTRGLVLAILKMSYFTQVYTKIKEKSISPSPRFPSS